MKIQKQIIICNKMQELLKEHLSGKDSTKPFNKLANELKENLETINDRFYDFMLAIIGKSAKIPPVVERMEPLYHIQQILYGHHSKPLECFKYDDDKNIILNNNCEHLINNISYHLGIIKDRLKRLKERIDELV